MITTISRLLSAALAVVLYPVFVAWRWHERRVLVRGRGRGVR